MAVPVTQSPKALTFSKAAALAGVHADLSALGAGIVNQLGIALEGSDGGGVDDAGALLHVWHSSLKRHSTQHATARGSQH